MASQGVAQSVGAACWVVDRSVVTTSVGWDLSGVLDRTVVLDMLLDTRMTSIVQGGFDVSFVLDAIYVWFGLR